MNRIPLVVVCLVFVASISSSVVIAARARARVVEHDERLGTASRESARLTIENERLSNLVAQVKSSSSLSREQLQELLRLRSEFGQLSKTAAQQAAVEATNVELRAVALAREEELARAQAAPNYWAKDRLAYAGFADPESALKSLLAEMCSSNLNLRSWRDQFTPEAITRLEQEWQQDGVTDAQKEEQLKSMAEMLTASASGFHIVQQDMASPDECSIRLSFDGEGKTRTFVLKKIGNEWKLDDLVLSGQ